MNSNTLEPARRQRNRREEDDTIAQCNDPSLPAACQVKTLSSSYTARRWCLSGSDVPVRIVLQEDTSMHDMHDMHHIIYRYDVHTLLIGILVTRSYGTSWWLHHDAAVRVKGMC